MKKLIGKVDLKKVAPFISNILEGVVSGVIIGIILYLLGFI